MKNNAMCNEIFHYNFKSAYEKRNTFTYKDNKTCPKYVSLKTCPKYVSLKRKKNRPAAVQIHKT